MLTEQQQRRLMESALEAAERGMAAGEVPIGAAVATSDGRIIASGYNQLNATKDRTLHAEIVAFHAAAGKYDLNDRTLVLVSTLEPCVMCFGAAIEAGIGTVIYGLPAPADGGPGRVKLPTSPESQMPKVTGNILSDRSRRLLERWLAGNANSDQAAYVKQLLHLT